MKILIVEDELPVARQIAAALTEDGHDSKAVHSGEAALEELSKGPFDLIVVDVGLPGINGFELLRRLREQHLASRVLLLTGRSAVEDRGRACSSGPMIICRSHLPCVNSWRASVRSGADIRKNR